MAPYTLYSYWRSTASWRVKLALDYKKIPYNSIDIDLLHGEQLDGHFVDINPNASVPVLKIPFKIPDRHLPPKAFVGHFLSTIADPARIPFDDESEESDDDYEASVMRFTLSGKTASNHIPPPPPELQYLTQSMAIFEYLEKEHPEHSFVTCRLFSCCKSTVYRTSHFFRHSSFAKLACIEKCIRNCRRRS